MKKLCFALFLMLACVMQFCTSSRKNRASAHPKITYMNNIQPIVTTSCAPCHVPPEGKKKPYNNYANAKSDIDDILAAIQKNPGEKGFMPARHPKLPDATIEVFKQWKADGLLEK